ncbi:hypothetical protein KPH14_001340 [Odynerus spinipes]|uniref:Uncharacterized protein n=1 Tax=Odynerus spinipes TaxID=1348599 RepID=A0AAD9REA9_9HYME|nr:hypothetical protein KPH14_001340 [Odynerus spinipes]
MARVVSRTAGLESRVAENRLLRRVKILHGDWRRTDLDSLEKRKTLGRNVRSTPLLASPERRNGLGSYRIRRTVAPSTRPGYADERSVHHRGSEAQSGTPDLTTRRY